MLEMDYEIKRQEGTGYERIFHVDEKLKTIKSNAVYIKAPNARGKSTFLNILAIALYGNRLDESDSRISISLRNDIKYMIERENQKYTFNVTIFSKDGSVQLISTKKNPISNDIMVKEIIDGKERLLPFQTFKDEYFLIYDIPEDPLNRITEILSDVKNQQIRYKNKVAEFKKYLGEIKQEIALSRNADEIESKKNQIIKFEILVEQFKKELATRNDKIRIIESYLALREFKNYTNLSLSYGDNIDRKSQKKKKHQTTVKTFRTRYENKKDEINNKIFEIESVILEVISKIDNLFIDRNYDEIKKHIKAIKNINLCTNFEINKNIFLEINYFRKIIDDYLNDKQIKESGKLGSFYQEIINIFEQYTYIDVFLPGIEKSIKELILLLKEEYKKNSKQKLIFDTLNDCNKKFGDLLNELEKMPKELQTLKMLYNKKGELSSIKIEDEQLDSQIDDLGNKLDTALEKVEKYKKMALKHGISIDKSPNLDKIDELKDEIFKQNKQFVQIFQFDEKSILAEIISIEKEIDEYKKKLSDQENIIRQYRQKLSDLESRKPHKYQNYSHKIDDLSNIVDTLERNLIEYEGIIQKIANGSKLTSEIENKYNEEISLYFAKKIPEFPYINEFIQPKKIDFLNKEIILENERKIDMKDISTGQSMSMYIQAVLNRPQDDKRKMIVIFDEGATMDSNSLKPIKNILKKHINENKVLFAVFAKAVDEELQVTELI